MGAVYATLPSWFFAKISYVIAVCIFLLLQSYTFVEYNVMHELFKLIKEHSGNPEDLLFLFALLFDSDGVVASSGNEVDAMLDSFLFLSQIKKKRSRFVYENKNKCSGDWNEKCCTVVAWCEQHGDLSKRESDSFENREPNSSFSVVYISSPKGREKRSYKVDLKHFSVTRNFDSFVVVFQW